MTPTGEEMQERVVQTFHAFCEAIMGQLHPYMWGQPTAVGRLSVISAVAALELLAAEMRRAGGRDLKIPKDIFDSAVELCQQYQMQFDFTVQPREEVIAARKSHLH